MHTCVWSPGQHCVLVFMWGACHLRTCPWEPGPCPHRLTLPGSWQLFWAVQTGSESDPVTCLGGGGGIVPAATSSRETCPQARVLALVLRLLWEQASPDFLSVVFDSFFRFTCFTSMQVTYLLVQVSDSPPLSCSSAPESYSRLQNRLFGGPQTTLKFSDSLEGLPGLSQADVVTLRYRERTQVKSADTKGHGPGYRGTRRQLPAVLSQRTLANNT